MSYKSLVLFNLCDLKSSKELEGSKVVPMTITQVLSTLVNVFYH